MQQTTRSYNQKIFILSLIPLVLMVFFGFFNITKALSNMHDVSIVRNSVFDLISSYYEMHYLQEERLRAAVYANDKNNENLQIYQTAQTAEYQKLSENDNNKLKQLRTLALSQKTTPSSLATYYCEISDNLLKTLLQDTKLEINSESLSKNIETYRKFLQFSENFAKQELYLFTILSSKNPTSSDIYQLRFLNDIGETIKNELRDSVDGTAKEILEKYLASNQVVAIEQLIKSSISNQKTDLENTIYLEQTTIRQSELFIVNNYLVNNIDDMASQLYEDEIKILTAIVFTSIIIVIFSLFFGYRLKNSILKDIQENMLEIENKNEEINELYNHIDKYVILSRTDLQGKITYASMAFCDISGFTRDELYGKPHNLVRHPDMPKEAFGELWDTIKSGKIWTGDVKNLKKGGGFYWVKARISPTFNKDGKIIGYTSIRQDITQQKIAEELHKTVNNLLANANQGFMSFESNMIAKRGCSKESFKILSTPVIAGKKISELLFGNDASKKETFEFGVENIFGNQDDNSKDLLISLLPQENKINDITFTIKYKLLEDNQMMVILEDVTEKRALEEQIEFENRIQKMIVVIATRKYEFIELKNEFMEFASKIDENVSIIETTDNNFIHITKVLHTFKGLFAQEELVNITQAIHELESKLDDLKRSNSLTNDSLANIVKEADLASELQKDLNFVSEILGSDFLEAQNVLTVDEKNFKSFENQLVEISNKNKISKKEMLPLLFGFFNLNKKPLKHLLNIYPKRVKNMAERFNKEIYNFTIDGDQGIVVQGNYSFFIQSLVHIFRNIIDHGIETPIERIQAGKDPIGKITCSYKQIDDYIITIDISDDGRGIDLMKIKQIALEKNLRTEEQIENMSDEDVMKILFENNFSTKADTDILSGRGVGMNAVKNELDKIGGTIDIHSKLGKGTTFTFTLPAKSDISIEFDDEEKILAEKVLVCASNILTESFATEIELIENKPIMVMQNVYSTVKLSSNNDVLVILSSDSNMTKALISLFLPQDVNLDELDGDIELGVIDEILNTIVGRAMSEFPQNYKNLELGSPMHIDKNILETIESNNLSYNYFFTTKHGSMQISTIFLN